MVAASATQGQRRRRWTNHGVSFVSTVDAHQDRRNTNTTTAVFGRCCNRLCLLVVICRRRRRTRRPFPIGRRRCQSHEDPRIDTIRTHQLQDGRQDTARQDFGQKGMENGILKIPSRQQSPQHAMGRDPMVIQRAFVHDVQQFVHGQWLLWLSKQDTRDIQSKRQRPVHLVQEEKFLGNRSFGWSTRSSTRSTRIRSRIRIRSTRSIRSIRCGRRRTRPRRPVPAKGMGEDAGELREEQIEDIDVFDTQGELTEECTHGIVQGIDEGERTVAGQCREQCAVL